VLAGLARLDAIARARHGRAFADLGAGARAAVVATLAAEPEGPRTIEVALGLVLEAAFGDPVYGVNPDGIGWAWIGHEPALPRPKAPWRAGKRG
jgi:gluconate 2-dehydrogenase gamma chain